MAMGGGAAAPKPTGQQKAATAAQTSLLQQEQSRIAKLEAVLSEATVNAQRQMGITSTGRTLDQLVGQILGSGQSGSEFAKSYQAPLPEAPPAPGPKLSYEQFKQQNNLPPEVKTRVPNGPDITAEQVAQQNRQKYETYLQQYDVHVRDYGDYVKQYGTPDPGASPGDPGQQMSFDQWLQATGKTPQAAIGKPGKSGYKDISTQRTELVPAYQAYQQDWQNKQTAYTEWLQRSQQYEADKAAGTGASANRTGQSRTGYEAGTIADLMKQISERASSMGEGALDQSLTDRLRGALIPNTDEETAKNALMERILSLTTGQGASTFQSLLDRVTRGASGHEPIDPAVQRELDRQEATMGNALRKQLGTGYQTSTAGAMRLGDFAQARAAAVAKDQREGLQSAVQALLGYAESPTAPINQRISLEAQGTARVQDALSQLTNYQAGQQNNLTQLINNLTGYENSILGRQSNTAQQYLQLQAMPYQDYGRSQVAQGYGNVAAAQNPYATPGTAGGASTVAGAASGALTGAGSGAMMGSAFGPWGTAIGALAGAIVGGVGGGSAAR